MSSFSQPDGITRATWETERLFEEYFSNLVRYLRSGLRNPNDLEDVAQEAFLRYFRARCNGEQIANPKGWLYRVARRLMLDSLKKSKPTLLDENGWKDLEARHAFMPDLESQDASDRLARLPWDSLTALERECLLLRAQGLTFREVAEVLGVTISTVASYVARGIKKLRKSVKETREAPRDTRTPPLR